MRRFRVLSFVANSVVGATALGGCGGGGGGSSGGAPPPTPTGVVSRVFPPAGGLTDDTTIVVRGTAASPQGVSGVTVAGVAATSNDGFATWAAAVPLALGANALPVVATTTVGALPALPPVVVDRVGARVTTPRGLVFDAANDRVYAFDREGRQLVRVDLATSAAEVVSSDAVGGGALLPNAFGMAVDLTAGRAALASSDGGGVVTTVDLASGDRAILTGQGVGTGPALTSGADVAIVDDKGTLAVADLNARALVRVDPETGERTVLSSDAVGTGPAFPNGAPSRLAADPAHGRVFVIGGGGLYAVDVATGDRTLVSGNGVGNGPSLIPLAVALDASPDHVLVARNAVTLELLRVELATGDRVAVPVPAGSPALQATQVLTFDAAGNRLLVAEPRGGAVAAVDLDDGARTTVWKPGRGVGPEFLDVDHATLAVADDLAWVHDMNRSDALLRVDLATGDRTLVTSAVGPSLAAAPAQLAYDPVGDRVLVLGMTSGASSLLAVHPITGDRTLMTDPAPAFGPVLSNAFSVATNGTFAFVTNGSPAGVLRVDLASGVRTTVADPSTGAGAPFTTVNGIVVESATSTAWVGAVDTNPDFGVFQVDILTGDRTPVSTTTVGSGGGVIAHRTLSRVPGAVRWVAERSVWEAPVATGNRTVLSGNGIGHGPRLSSSADAICRPRADGLLVVVDRGASAVLVVDPTTGERLVVSR